MNSGQIVTAVLEEGSPLGSTLDFVVDANAPRGGMKHTFFTPDRKYAVQFFNDPRDEKSCESVSYISRLCDQNNIPFASNVATAEMLVLGPSRGDLDWRDIVHPQN